MKILVSDRLSEECVKLLRNEGAEVTFDPEISPDDLRRVIGDYDGLLVRSRTKVRRDVLEAGERLRVVGRAGVGVDNVDLGAATERGVLVMNTPDGNTISAAEHTVALALALCRHIPKATAQMAEGKWNRKLLGTELHGKTLGVVGLGRIGREVAQRLGAFSMRVIGYDPFTPEEVVRSVGVEPADLDAVVQQADVLTVHTPLNDETRGLFDRARLSSMKKGAVLINCARGGLVDEEALLELIDGGHLAGAALDVYAVEPLAEDSPLRKHPKLVCTPHLAATTQEAQEKVAVDVARQVVAYLRDGVISNAVNAVSVDAGLQVKLAPFMDVAERLGALQAQLADGGVQRLQLELRGDISTSDSRPLEAAFLAGFLRSAAGRPVNAVNAPHVARSMGLSLDMRRRELSKNFRSLLLATVEAGGVTRLVGGTVFGLVQPRLVRIDDYVFDAIPEGWCVLVANKDEPGVIGFLGAVLGDAHINIARMSLGRDEKGGRALAILGVDCEPPDELLDTFSRRAGVMWVRKVRF